MHDPVHRRSCRHRIGEHLLHSEKTRLGDAQRASLIALGYQGEQHLRLPVPLRQAATVVHDQQVEVSVSIVKLIRPDKIGSRSRAASPREFLHGPRR